MNDYISFNPARPNQRSNYLLTTFASNYDDLARPSVENIIRKVDLKDALLLKTSKHKNYHSTSKHNKGLLSKIAFYLHLSNPVEWVFIFSFSIIVSIYILILDRLILVGSAKRRLIASTSYPFFNFVIWIISSVLFFILATSVGYFISPDADGSGIPEMKTVLSGVTKYTYFSFNAFIGKSLGLFAALVGGASVGKVGPYVHLSCLICNRVMKINYFSKINKSTSLKTNMLSVACAAGITLALGSPLGGVLFSIESTASIYIVSNLWKAFFSAVVCNLVYKVFKKEQVITVVDPSVTEPQVGYVFNLVNFVIVGIMSGVIGAACSTLIAKGVYIRKKTKWKLLNSRFRFAAMVALITSVTTFYLTTLQRADRTLMNFCYSANDTSLNNLTHPGEGWLLLISFIAKFIITVLGLVCTMPAGVFGPVFAIGALFGRLYGHIVNYLFGVNMESAFAMAASAGAFSGFSHTVSSALMVFEITGQTRYLAPLLLCSLIANLIGQSLSMGIFDVLLAIKNLPHLPAIKSAQSYSMSAGDIMAKVDYVLEMDNLNIINAMIVLSKIPKKTYIHIPIVDRKRIVKYTVVVGNLLKYLIEVYEGCKGSYNLKGQSNFNEFFRYTKKKVFGGKGGFIEQMKKKFRKLYINLREKERLVLNKNFQHESCMRIVSNFQENAKYDNIFLKKKIDLKNKTLSADKSALTVDKSYPLVKIQFLFAFLNTSHIFVTDKGKLIGLITKDDFLKKTNV